MGQQMTPDTAKVKCKNFLATPLRLASDQPVSQSQCAGTYSSILQPFLAPFQVFYSFSGQEKDFKI